MSKKDRSVRETSISELPEDLILKILSLLSTKHAAVTSLLSKNWKSLWTRVPRLEYNFKDHKDDTSFERFIDKSLRSHQSHVIESVYVQSNPRVHNTGPWISTVIRHHHCHLRELEIDACGEHTILPPELFTCKTLVVLKLKGKFLVSVEPLTTVCLPSLKTLHIEHSHGIEYEYFQILLFNCNLTDLKISRRWSNSGVFEFDVSRCKTLVAMKLEGLKDAICIPSSSSSSAVCLPFLKTLHINRMTNFNSDSFRRLLSHCPVLSDLTLEERTNKVMLGLDIVMPCLQRLSIDIAKIIGFTDLSSLLEQLLVIAPALKYLSIQESHSSYFWFPFYMRVRLGRDTSKLVCANIFQRIVHMEMSICGARSERMLVDLLQCSTKLVVLKLESVYKLRPLESCYTRIFFPECLLSSLEDLEWRGYTGRDRDRSLMCYLLEHAPCLKTVKIFSDIVDKQ